LKSSMLRIYHNPRCSKSRETLALLENRGLKPLVVEYLKEPPSEEELRRVLSLLGMRAEELLRKGEALYREKYKGQELSEEQWIKVLAANPVLIERPIVITDTGAALGRPPEEVLKLF
jgi:arsenate reductase (glutaredoxin)